MTVLLAGLLFAQTIEFQGQKRNYAIKFPQSRPARMGLVVGLHCAGGNPAEQLAKWEKIATGDGCIMVAPESVGGASPWNDKDRDGFEYIKAIVEDVAKKHPIDRTRIILVGYSAGACHACRIGVPNSDYFTGIIAYAGASGQGFGNRKIPIALIHGTADKAVNFSTTERLAKELEQKGWPLFFKPIQGGGHEYNASFDREAWEFIKKNRVEPPPEILAEECLEKGRAAVKARKWKDAYKEFKAAEKTGAKSDEVKKAIDDLLAVGEKDLQKAIDSKKPAELKKIAAAWEGTPIEEKARAAIKE